MLQAPIITIAHTPIRRKPISLFTKCPYCIFFFCHVERWSIFAIHVLICKYSRRSQESTCAPCVGGGGDITVDVKWRGEYPMNWIWTIANTNVGSWNCTIHIFVCRYDMTHTASEVTCVHGLLPTRAIWPKKGIIQFWEYMVWSYGSQPALPFNNNTIPFHLWIYGIAEIE